MTARPPQKVRQLRDENLLDLRDATHRDVKHQTAESRVQTPDMIFLHGANTNQELRMAI